MRYILYARKSSESEDRQVQSIEDQLRVLREYATGRGLSIVAEITESKSAKAPNERPDFERMLKVIKRGGADAILCWAVNRLTRNPVDSGTLSWMLQNGELQAIETPERQYLPTDNVLIFSVETGTANQFIIDLKRNTKRGIQNKLTQGWYPHRALDGYLNDPISRTIIADPERFELIQRGWRLLVAGTHTPTEVISLLNDEWGFRTRPSVSQKSGTLRGGRPLSQSAGYRIFSSIFYTGYFIHNGQIYVGKHPAMLTLAEYDAVIKRGRTQGGAVRIRKHNHTYRGMIRCSNCGHLLTGELQTGQHKRGRWVYYHCANSTGKCSRKSIREDIFEAQLMAELARVTITPQVASIVKDALKLWVDTEFRDQERVLENNRRVLRDAQSLQNELVEMRLRRLIDDDLFNEKKEELQERINKARLASGRATTRLNDTRNTIETAVSYRVNAEHAFLAGDGEMRRSVALSLAEQFTFVNGEVRITLNPLLQALRTAENDDIEPPNNGSSNTKKTFSREKVPFGVHDGSVIEQLSKLNELFRTVWTNEISFSTELNAFRIPARDTAGPVPD